MEIGILAGNRSLPILLAKRLIESNKFQKITGICFKGETNPQFCRYLNRCLWVEPGKLGALADAIKSEGIKNWIMAGQINPLNIFKRKKWDDQLRGLAAGEVDFCPHNIFTAIIEYLEKEGVRFLEAVSYLKEDLAQEGLMNSLDLGTTLRQDLDFGLDKINKFVELDVGQTLVVKNKAVVALESLEGTDNTIRRGFRLAGKNNAVFKFAKKSQDLRFDVPVVGLSTLKLLKKVKASFLVLQKDRTIILNKNKFLQLSQKWKIPVIGA